MRSTIALVMLLAAPAAAQSEPDAAELLDRYRSALGDAETVDGIESLRCHGKAWWKGTDGEGFLTEVYGGLGKARITTEFALFGTFEMACDGDVVWERSPLGVTLREGWDASESIRQYAIAQHVDWRKLYVKARTVGVADVDGTACHEIQLHPRMLVRADAKVTTETPPPDVWYVDVESNLLRRVVAKSIGLLEEPVETRIDMTDWRDVDGVRFPHRVAILVSGFTLNVEYQSFERNVEIPEGFFAPEESVRAELAKQRDPAHKAAEREIRIEELEARHIASIRVTCKHADMQKTLAVLLPEAMQHVVAAGATMAGPPLVRYHSFGEELDIEAAMPVTAPVEPKGRVKAETLPAGRAVVAWHVGPYDELGRTHQRVIAYLAANGLEQRASCWEEYWTDPGMEPDPSKWRTKLVWPVK